MSQIVIANRLSDGRVVFLAKNGDAASWVAMLPDATVAADGDEATQLLEVAQTNDAVSGEVIDPLLIEVEKRGDGWCPTKYREEIRCFGPTMRLDLGKQAEGAAA